MIFSVDISDKEKVVLKNNVTGTFAEMFCFGALLNKFSIKRNCKEINVINGYENVDDATRNITNGFKSAKLLPFVCRIKNGEYVFENEKHKIDKFYMKSEAIHGLLFDRLFELKASGANDDSAFAEFEFSYNKANEGFPFPFKAVIKYELKKENIVTITTRIINTGNKNMPLADGWHSYFKLGQKIDDLMFQMNSEQMVEFDERLLPTGKILPFDKFFVQKKFGDTKFDHCFLLNENEKPACILTNEENNIEVRIIPDKSYPYLQIYTPDDRQSIAIENLSSAPDSFNNGMGLLIAKPNEEYVFSTAFQVSILKII